jgi:VanZ family protein
VPATGRGLGVLRSVGRALLRIPRAWAWLPVLAWMAFLWACSSSDGGPARGLLRFPFAGNFAHALAFGLLALLAIPCVRRDGSWSVLEPLQRASVLGFCLLYAFVDETHQSFVDGRNASAFDLVTDGVGALCVIWIARYVGARHASERGLWQRFGLGLFVCALAAGLATAYGKLYGGGPWL